MIIFLGIIMLGAYPTDTFYDPNRPSWLPYWLDTPTESEMKYGVTSIPAALPGAATAIGQTVGTTVGGVFGGAVQGTLQSALFPTGLTDMGNWNWPMILLAVGLGYVVIKKL